jgi:Uma2 family endonuclease
MTATRKGLIVGEEEEAGASPPHVLIVTNVVSELNQQVRNNCLVFSTDMYVKTPTNECSFPDVVVACGPKWGDCHGLRAVTNPILIIEVLSNSTKARAQNEKFDRYKSIDSFREYVLIEQQPHSVFHHWKEENDVWNEQHFKDSSDSILLRAVECVLHLAEIYRKFEHLGCE